MVLQTVQTELLFYTTLPLNFSYSKSPSSSSSSTLLSSYPLITPLLSPTTTLNNQLDFLARSIDTQAAGSSKGDLESARFVLAWGKYVLGDSEGSLKVLEGVSLGEKESGGERYDDVLRIIGWAVLGTSWIPSLIPLTVTNRSSVYLERFFTRTLTPSLAPRFKIIRTSDETLSNVLPNFSYDSEI